MRNNDFWDDTEGTWEHWINNNNSKTESNKEESADFQEEDEIQLKSEINKEELEKPELPKLNEIIHYQNSNESTIYSELSKNLPEFSQSNQNTESMKSQSSNLEIESIDEATVEPQTTDQSIIEITKTSSNPATSKELLNALKETEGTLDEKLAVVGTAMMSGMRKTVDESHKKQVQYKDLTDQNNHFMDDLRHDSQSFAIWFENLTNAIEETRFGLGDDKNYVSHKFENLHTRNGINLALMKIFELEFNGIAVELDETELIPAEKQYSLSGLRHSSLFTHDTKQEVKNLIGNKVELDALYANIQRVEDDADANNILKYSYDGQIKLLNDLVNYEKDELLRNFKQIMKVFTGKDDAETIYSPSSSKDKVMYKTRELLQKIPKVGEKIPNWERKLSDKEKIEYLQNIFSKKLSELSRSISMRRNASDKILNEKACDKEGILEDIVTYLLDEPVTSEKNNANQFIYTTMKKMFEAAQERKRYNKMTEADRKLLATFKDENTESACFDRDIAIAKNRLGFLAYEKVEEIKSNLEKCMQDVNSIYTAMEDNQKEHRVFSKVESAAKQNRSSNAKWYTGLALGGALAASALLYVGQTKMSQVGDYIVASIDEMVRQEVKSVNNTITDEIDKFSLNHTETIENYKREDEERRKDLEYKIQDLNNNKVTEEEILEIARKQAEEAQRIIIEKEQAEKQRARLEELTNRYEFCIANSTPKVCNSQAEFRELLGSDKKSNYIPKNDNKTISKPAEKSLNVVFGTYASNKPGLVCDGPETSINLYNCETENTSDKQKNEFYEKLGGQDAWKSFNAADTKKDEFVRETISEIFNPIQYIRTETIVAKK